MSEQERRSQEVEQITAPPTEHKKPEKDPKKVAAGKKLAEYNKKAKLALQREVQREKEEEESSKDSWWFTKISFSTAVSFVGIVLGGVNLYFRLKPKDDFKHEMKVTKADHIKSDHTKADEVKETKSKILIRVGML